MWTASNCRETKHPNIVGIKRAANLWELKETINSLTGNFTFLIRVRRLDWDLLLTVSPPHRATVPLGFYTGLSTC